MAALQQQPRVTTAMDQATQAMLAVFISNLVFWLPSIIYIFVNQRTLYWDFMFGVILSTHLAVDPLVYMCVNTDHRDKVKSWARHVMQVMCCWVQQTGQHASPHHQELETETSL